MEFERFGSATSAFYNLLVSIGAFEWAYAASLKAVRRLVPPGGRLLEIGPGVGALLKKLISAGYDAVGVDASPPMLRYSRAKGVSVAGVSFLLPLRGEAAHGLSKLHIPIAHDDSHGKPIRHNHKPHKIPRETQIKELPPGDPPSHARLSADPQPSRLPRALEDAGP